MRITGIWLILFFLTAHVSAQTSFKATISKQSLGVSERFQLQFTITGGNNLADFRPPTLSDFIVLGGPNQSNKTSVSTSGVVQTFTLSYILQPKTTGTFTIGAAYIKSDNKTYSTQPLKVEVTNAPAPTSKGNQNTTGNSGNEDITTFLRDNILIKTEISDNEVYVGESFNVSLKLCIPDDGRIYSFKGFQNIKSSAYDGFYSEDVSFQEESLKREVINGKTYNTTIFKRDVLTPQRSGNLILDPFTADGVFTVKVKSQKKSTGDPFQDMLNEYFGNPFVNTQDFYVPLASKTLAVQVKELPSGAPADFNGAVGKFSMKTQISSTHPLTDEPLTYRITISGSGNLQLFPAPTLNLPPGWETYDPKVIESPGQKTFEFPLIARSPGKFTLSPYSWSYFDPAGKKYVTIQAETYPVEVTPGPGYNPNANTFTGNKEKVETLGEDIRFIQKDAPAYGDTRKNISSITLFLLTCIPVFGGIALTVFTSKQRKMNRDVKAVRAAGANSAAKKRLNQASIYLQQKQSRAFYDETIRALWGYLSDKLHIPQHNLSKETMHTVLLEKNISESTIQLFLKTIDTCEMSVFSPQVQEEQMQEVYQAATHCIESLEKELR